MCLMSKRYDWANATVSDQKNMKDFIEIVMRPMNFDTIATEGSSCGTFVPLGAGCGNSQLLTVAFEYMWHRNFRSDDVASLINVPARNDEN